MSCSFQDNQGYEKNNSAQCNECNRYQSEKNGFRKTVTPLLAVHFMNPNFRIR